MRTTTWITSLALCALAGAVALRGGPTEIEALPFVIDAPGRYVVTRDLLGPADADGVTIAAGDVLLDLAGHTLEGSEGSGHGIVALPGLERIELRDGVVRLFGDDGVDLAGCDGVRLTRVSALDNGGHGIELGHDAELVDCEASLNHGGRGMVLGDRARLVRCRAHLDEYGGIQAGDDATLEDCQARRCGYGAGIRLGDRALVAGGAALENDDAGLVVGRRALVRGFSAQGNLAVGVRAGAESVLQDCVAQGTRDGDGIAVAGGALARGCRSGRNEGSGIAAGARCELTGCVTLGNARHGIVAGGGSTLLRNRAEDSREGDGLRVGGTGAVLIGNQALRNARADLRLVGTRHLVFGNRARKGRLEIEAGSRVGPWLEPADAAAAGDPAANVLEPDGR